MLRNRATFKLYNPKANGTFKNTKAKSKRLNDRNEIKDKYGSRSRTDGMEIRKKVLKRFGIMRIAY